MTGGEDSSSEQPAKAKQMNASPSDALMLTERSYSARVTIR